MEATAIIPRSALEQRYDLSREEFDDEKCRSQAIQAEVEDRLEEMFGDCELHHHDVIEMELDIINELVNVKVEYCVTDRTEHCSGTYDTPPYTWGHVEIEYVITVLNEDGEEEQEIEDSFKF